MKSEKIDISNNPNTSSLEKIIAEYETQPPKNSVLIDKSLLPSKGILYPDKIYAKKLSTINIKKLATITEQNSTFVVNNILMSCIWGIDVNKILVADKLWLVFFLRAHTYNDLPFRLRGTCKACGAISNYDYTLKDLFVTRYDKPLPEYFDVDGDQVEVRFPTISTEAAVEKIKNDPNAAFDIDPGMLDFSSYIYKINGKEVTLVSAYEYVCELDGMSFSRFTNELSEYMFAAAPTALFKCPHCEEQVEIPVPFSPSFFLPKV